MKRKLFRVFSHPASSVRSTLAICVTIDWKSYPLYVVLRGVLHGSVEDDCSRFIVLAHYAGVLLLNDVDTNKVYKRI